VRAHGRPLMVHPMKLLPMTFPVLVASHVKVVFVALDHVPHFAPNLVPTSRSQFATASAMAAPRPSNSFVLVKGRNFARPLMLTTSSLHAVS
jgi:hypothetical protein